MVTAGEVDSEERHRRVNQGVKRHVTLRSQGRRVESLAELGLPKPTHLPLIPYLVLPTVPPCFVAQPHVKARTGMSGKARRISTSIVDSGPFLRHACRRGRHPPRYRDCDYNGIRESKGREPTRYLKGTYLFGCASTRGRVPFLERGSRPTLDTCKPSFRLRIETRSEDSNGWPL